jgi:hypothetical protein
MSFLASEVSFLQVMLILPQSILEDSTGISTGYLILSFKIGHSLHRKMGTFAVL